MVNEVVFQCILMIEKNYILVLDKEPIDESDDITIKAKAIFY